MKETEKQILYQKEIQIEQANNYTKTFIQKNEETDIRERGRYMT